MRKLATLLISILLVSLIAACSTADKLDSALMKASESLPAVYRINVQQGNVITQEMVDQLYPGMDTRQVKFLLGSPLLVDPFRSNRWDYFYTLSVAGKAPTKERLSLYFMEDKLVNLSGSFKPSNDFKPMLLNTQVVDVPKRKKKEPNMIEKALHTIGIEYDDPI